MIDRHAKQASMIESDITVIRAELERLLNERRFSGAPQMSAFLRYIVNETLEGNADRIKAFSVGVDALGKPDTFDAQTDPSVRVLALRLRKTLDVIYEDKSSCLAIISLRVGTYVPTFLKTSGERPSELVSSDRAVKSTSVASIGYQRVAEGVHDDDSANLQKESKMNRGAFAINVPADQPLANGSIKRSTEASPLVVTMADNRTYSKWLLMFGAVLLMAAWQSGVKQADAQASIPSNPVTLAGLDSANSAALAPVTAFADTGPSGLPTIVVRSVSDELVVERRAVLILTSKFVQSKVVEVIKADDSAANRSYVPGEYQLYINSYVVADEVRLNTQLINLRQGEMLFSATVTLSHKSNRFSSEDVGTVESIAQQLTSKEGPLFKHYCALRGGAAVDTCSETQDT